MDISTYLLPSALSPDDVDMNDMAQRARCDTHYAKAFANHYDISRMERDAAAATGISYYDIIGMDASTLPAPWGNAFAVALAHNAAIDVPVKAASITEAQHIFSKPEWTQQDWRRLVTLGYARFDASEASADGAFWNIGYTLIKERP